MAEEPLRAMLQLRSALLLVLLAPVVSGCVAVAAAGVAGVGYVQYQRNEVEHDFPADLTETWRATLEVLREMGIEEPKAELGSTEGVIEHEEMLVRVERHAQGFTRVRVRVGTFYTGDHARRTQLLLEKIDSALKQEGELRDWSEKVKGLTSDGQTAATEK